MSEGRLFVVATPIGNLGDLTLRAIETLKACPTIAAEDTRRTRALLSHLGIAGKRVVRLDEHAPPAEIAALAGEIAAGANVALVTDAGTPVVSDPGTALVAAVAARGARVVPIPGASALLAAASASGLVSGPFRFAGFLPRGGPERAEAVAAIAKGEEPVVLFESPHRVAATLSELAARCPERAAVIARELTKVHEELVRGSLADLARDAEAREWLGEITLVLGPAPRAREDWSDERLDRRIDEELARGARVKQVAEVVALESGRKARDVYARALERKDRARQGER